MSDFSFPFGPAESYADGGYAIAYVMGDGEYLCADCVNDPSNPVLIGDADRFSRCDEWTVIGIEVLYDSDPECAPYCVHCNAAL